MSTKSYQTKFAFIIPTLNNREGLRLVLQDIANNYPYAHIVLVNNSSNSVEDLSNSSTLQILYLSQNRNTGFAKACNDGAKAAREHFNSEYLVFLNDDVRFSSDWVEDCIKTMIDKKWFATTPLLKKPDGTVENVGYKVLSQGKVEQIQYKVSNIPSASLRASKVQTNIDGLTAAALVINSKDFFLMKGFDERFFAYLEDVDLFLRAKKNGKKFGTTMSSFVIHHGQGTSTGMKTFKAWLDVKNWYLFIYKHWKREDYLKHGVEIAIERLRNLSGLLKSFF